MACPGAARCGADGWAGQVRCGQRGEVGMVWSEEVWRGEARKGQAGAVRWYGEQSGMRRKGLAGAEMVWSGRRG